MTSRQHPIPATPEAFLCGGSQVCERYVPGLQVRVHVLHGLQVGVHVLHRLQVGVHVLHGLQVGVHVLHGLKVGVHVLHAARTWLHHLLHARQQHTHRLSNLAHVSPQNGLGFSRTPNTCSAFPRAVGRADEHVELQTITSDTESST